MMEELETIADRSVYFIDQNGETRAVVIKIGKPRRIHELWEIYVALDGLYDKTYLIKGVDSFQAVCLAMGFIRNVLAKYIEQGGRFLWSDKSAEIDLDTMFS
jgi:hypothetical protein